MKRTAVVNGRPLQIELNADGAFTAGGREGVASVVSAGPGCWSVLIGGRSFTVQSDGLGFLVDGESVTVEIEDPRALRRQAAHGGAAGRQSLVAAMPGKVIRVLVSVGDTVEAGQGIVVVEAMKMQNEVKAPKAGRVVSIGVQEGAAVTAGVTLAVVE